MNISNKQREMESGERVQMEAERMLGERQQWCLCNHLTRLMKGSFRGKAEGANRKILLITELFYICLGLGFFKLFFSDL